MACPGRGCPVPTRGFDGRPQRVRVRDRPFGTCPLRHRHGPGTGDGCHPDLGGRGARGKPENGATHTVSLAPVNVNLRVSRGPAARAAAGLALGAICLASCGASAPGAASGGPAAPSLPTPLATSVEGGGGTWATVPMGDLRQPANTFWQLFFRRDGARTWSNQVEATATATNGGLVLAPAGHSLLVGVRPSQLLTFTPLISTADAGGSWSTGLISQGLASRPTALAMSPGGGALALVNGRGGPEVLESTGSLSSWRPLVTGKALAGSPLELGLRPWRADRRRATPAARHLAAPPSGRPVIGTSCRRPGVVGIFEEDTTVPGRSWGQRSRRGPGRPRSSTCSRPGTGWRR